MLGCSCMWASATGCCREQRWTESQVGRPGDRQQHCCLLKRSNNLQPATCGTWILAAGPSNLSCLMHLHPSLAPHAHVTWWILEQQLVMVARRDRCSWRLLPPPTASCAHCCITGKLSDTRQRFLGTRPPRLFAVSVRGSRSLLALSSRPWLGYSDMGKWQFMPLSYEALDHAAVSAAGVAVSSLY